MPDLTPAEVRSLLASSGLSALDDEELVEITHRINALTETVMGLEHPDLDAQEPDMVFGEEGA